MTNPESQTRSEEMQAKSERLANGLLHHAAFQQNFGHGTCHDPQCKVCRAGAIIVSECLSLPALLTAEAERDELNKNGFVWLEAHKKVVEELDQLRAELANSQQVLRDLVDRTIYQGNSVSWIYAKKNAYAKCIDEMCALFKMDGNTSVVEYVKRQQAELATAKAENAALMDAVKSLLGDHNNVISLKDCPKCEVLRTLAEKGVVL